mmetsp:Transcript_66421/g.194819  ORF Transcript_66421/g.194819 Transcript_66421/m.194819 type:complete len:262 (-) Transcript_66421:707-1492(-)
MSPPTAPGPRPHPAALGEPPVPCCPRHAEAASSTCLPFCRNWKTAVATSVRAGFLSGCHSRRSARKSFIRCSLGWTPFSFMSCCKASPFAFSTSGSAAADDEAAALLVCSTQQLLLLELLSTERLLPELLPLLDLFLFLPFFFFFFFFLPSLLEELALLLDFEPELLRFLLLPRELLDAGEPPARCALKASRMARAPAWGDSVRRGAIIVSRGASRSSPIDEARGSLHLKHSKRFTKLRSLHLEHIQSRLLSSSSRSSRRL